MAHLILGQSLGSWTNERVLCSECGTRVHKHDTFIGNVCGECFEPEEVVDAKVVETDSELDNVAWRWVGVECHSVDCSFLGREVWRTI